MPASATERTRSPTGLRIGIDTELPARIAAGKGNALFIAGWCFAESRILRLELVLGDERTAAMAFALPRADLEAELAAEHAYLSGFWGIVPIHEHPDTTRAELSLAAVLDDGSEIVEKVAGIELGAAPAPVEPPGPEGEIAICMATFEPPADLFQRQVDTIRAQTHTDWICLISDDNSSPHAFAAIERVVGGDPRFLVSRSERRLGFFSNFERALSMAPASARFIALADQDDSWYPEKLQVLKASIGDAAIAYGDARVVDREGNLLSSTYWSHRRNNWTNFASLLLANCVSGPAALYRRELLEVALPFPVAKAGFFHDHWLAVAALAGGRIAYIDRPLYDYVQHSSAVLGHERAHAWAKRLRGPAAKARLFARDPQFYYRHWQTTYFSEYIRAAVMARVLLMRCEPSLSPGKRRALRRLAGADRSFAAIAWLLARRLRTPFGLGETLRAERRLLQAFVWRYLLERATPRLARPSRWLPCDASFRGRQRDEP